MKEDTIKYLYELTLKALKYERKLKVFKNQRYYSSNSDFFKLLETRNESLNSAINVLNKEIGITVEELRIHQIKASHVYDALKTTFLEYKEKKVA